MTWEQTSEVLAREVDRLQKGIDLINEHLDNAALSDHDARWAAFGVVNPLVSPAAEGGGAANGGESQALQAAILGLHTLAGEFPTPMFKTREDYLQATISEINEIIGKQ